MFVPIQMQVGEEAIGILPGVSKQFGIDHIKAITGKIVNIKPINSEQSVEIYYKDYSVIAPRVGSTNGSWNPKRVKILDYRILKFTFGGVFQMNPQFDLDRIEKEEGVKLDPAFLYWL